MSSESFITVEIKYMLMKMWTSEIKLPKLKLVVVIITIMLIAEASHARQFNFSGNREKQAISFNVIKNLIIIPVYVNGKGPFNFILDTGVGPMIISDPSLIDSLKLQNLRSIKIIGLGKGNEIEAYVSTEISAKVGNSLHEHIPTAILKADVFRLSGYLGIPIHGLLGYHFFKSFIVEVNYSRKRLIFYLPTVHRKLKGTRIPLDMINDKPYTTVTVEIPELGRIPVKMLVDNGASHAISLETLNGQPFPIPIKSIEANLGVGLGGPISGSIGRVPLLEINKFRLKNVLTSFPKYDDAAGKTLIKDRNGNMGADVLSRFNTVFDYANNALYLKPNFSYKRPFEHDMAGMEVYVDATQKNRYFIGRIEPNSPAQTAGLMADDELISINFTAVSTFNLTEVNRLLKSGDGKLLILTIARQGTLFIKMLKLKQRI